MQSLRILFNGNAIAVKWFRLKLTRKITYSVKQFGQVIFADIFW